jgi:SAM-dependent methyltransferase
MRFGDRILQRWRIAKAARWITAGARLLDIGCADGAIFRQLNGRISDGIGVDPGAHGETQMGKGQLVRGFFPKDLPEHEPFDAITLLAVLEHIPTANQTELATNCVRYLKPGGRLIITVPAPFVDRILGVLKSLRIVDGMSLDEHYGFEPAQTPGVFEPAGLRLLAHRRFQMGLNYLFVFEKPTQAA